MQNTKIVLSTFELYNARSYYAPGLKWQMKEQSAGDHWFVNAGESRCYIVKASPRKDEKIIIEEEDCAGSHFVANRTISSILMAHGGLFIPYIRGRVAFIADDPFKWRSQLNLNFENDAFDRVHQQANQFDFESWLGALLAFPILRRAIDDLVLALRNPHEAFIWIYRGFEWLEKGSDIKRDEMARSLGASVKELKDLNKLANVETGIRHATKDGRKMRADAETYTSWSCALLAAC